MGVGRAEDVDLMGEERYGCEYETKSSVVRMFIGESGRLHAI